MREFDGRPSDCHSRESGNPGRTTNRMAAASRMTGGPATPLTTPPLRGSRGPAWLADRSRAERRRLMRWGGNVPLHRIGHSPAARCRPTANQRPAQASGAAVHMPVTPASLKQGSTACSPTCNAHTRTLQRRFRSGASASDFPLPCLPPTGSPADFVLASPTPPQGGSDV